MGTFAVDTHRLIEDLKSKGFTETQAEGVTETLKSLDLEHLASKADVKSEINGLEIRLIKWLVPMLLGQIGVFAIVVKWLLG